VAGIEGECAGCRGSAHRSGSRAVANVVSTAHRSNVPGWERSLTAAAHRRSARSRLAVNSADPEPTRPASRRGTSAMMNNRRHQPSGSVRGCCRGNDRRRPVAGVTSEELSTSASPEGCSRPLLHSLSSRSPPYAAADLTTRACGRYMTCECQGRHRAGSSRLSWAAGLEPYTVSGGEAACCQVL